MHLKALLLLLTVPTVLGYSVISRSKYRMLLYKCTAENPTVRTIEILRARGGVFSDRPEFHKFLYCCFHSAGLLQNDGSVDYKTLEDLLKTQNTPNDVIENSRISTDYCNAQTVNIEKYYRAWSVVKCLYYSLPKSISI